MLDDVRHGDGGHLFIVKGGTAMQLRPLRQRDDRIVVFWLTQKRSPTSPSWPEPAEVRYQWVRVRLTG